MRVALAEAMAACAFDWRQSLQQRIAGGAVYATRTYAARLRDVSDVDRSNWAGTQADHAIGRCRRVRVFVIAGAPNTATTRFVRVVLTQTVSSPATAAQSSVWVATYRLLRGSDARWLVDAELDGGS